MMSCQAPKGIQNANSCRASQFSHCKPPLSMFPTGICLANTKLISGIASVPGYDCISHDHQITTSCCACFGSCLLFPRCNLLKKDLVLETDRAAFGLVSASVLAGRSGRLTLSLCNA